MSSYGSAKMRFRRCNMLGLLLFFGCGCVSHTTRGRDIDSSKISLIHDGVTTEGQVYLWFGLCTVKDPRTPDSVDTWHYKFSDIDTTPTPGFFLPSVETKDRSKELIVRVKNGIVTSHEYIQGKTQQQMVD